jgi:y4mF family transcriptional regulator
MKIDSTVFNQQTMRTLGSAIRSRRKNLRLSQGELADLAGVSVNLLSQVEKGKTTTQICKLLDIISTLGLQFVLDDGKDRILIKNEPAQR